MDQARSQYSYLKNADLAFTQAPPNSGLKGFLEFWPPGEPGAPDTPRPKELPMGKPGIQNISAKTRPIDILGDYVSHYAVDNDPKLQQMYGQFKSSLDPRIMQERYQWDRSNQGETRPFEEWANASGYPAMFRGYTFDQWPNAEKHYTKDQLKILDNVRSYLGIGKKK